jgi:hypothetical protein
MGYDILSEIISEIISHVTEGSTYKSCALVSRAWHKAAWAQRKKIPQLTNHLLTLIKQYPKASWDLTMVSAHKLINLSAIKANRWFQWDWQIISAQPYITMDIIRDNPRFPWSVKGIASNPNIDWAGILIFHANLGPKIWHKLSRNKSLNIDLITKYRNMPWDWEGLTSNRAITPQDILAHPEFPWAWHMFSFRVKSIELIR